MDAPAVPKSQLVFGALVYWITILAAIICIIGPIIAFVDMDNNVINPHYEMQNIFDGMKSDFNEQELQMDATAGDSLIYVEDAGKFDDPDDIDRDIDIRIIDSDGNGEIAVITAIDKKKDTLELEEVLLNSYSAERTEVAEVTVWDSKGNQRLEVNAQAGQNTLTLSNTERIDDPTAEQPIAVIIRDNNNREKALLQSIDRDTNTVVLADTLVNSYSTANEAVLTQVTVVDEVEDGHFWIDKFTTGDGFTQFGLAIGCAVGIPAMVGTAIVFAFKEKSLWWALGALLIAAMIAISAVGLFNV